MKMVSCPSIEISNASNDQWQVQVVCTVSDDAAEQVSISVLVPRSDASVGDVQQQAIRRAITLLQQFQ